MSRIGKKSVTVPQGVTVSVKNTSVEVKGKLGTLTREFPKSIKIEVKGSEVHVQNLSDDPKKRSLHGLSRTLVSNMVIGVSAGYEKNLELQGVGYRAAVQGDKLTMTLGFSHPVVVDLPQGVKAKVDANTKINLSGPDKEVLGQLSARLRKIRPPEPYKGKGVRYAGEVITLKQGKAAGAK